MWRIRYFLGISCALLVVSLAQGEVYKWVDEKGVPHYADKPPSEKHQNKNKQKAQKLELRHSQAYKGVKVLIPIKYTADVPAPLINFEELQIALSGANADSVQIGTRTQIIGPNCSKPRPLYWRKGGTDLGETLIANMVLVKFQEQNYRIIRSKLVHLTPSASRLALRAKITKMKLNVCASQGELLGVMSAKAFVFLNVQWELHDRILNKKLYQVRTQGSENAFDEFKDKGVLTAMSKALEMATNNLLADKIFVGHLKPTDKDKLAIQQFDPMFIKLQYPQPSDQPSSFKLEIERLKQSAVTIRTEQGHGSGVLLDTQGHILTNAHVVGKNEDVIVIYNNRRIAGRVIRLEEMRDVAIIKTPPLHSMRGVTISKNKMTEGDTVYVIGTPLDVSLSNTVTKGVYSAHRRLNGLPFYQTDAAINAGNSGGPAFNEQGELVGISVAGLFTREGASLNVNYLIPIDNAVTILNIKPEPNISHILNVANEPPKQAK